MADNWQDEHLGYTNAETGDWTAYGSNWQPDDAPTDPIVGMDWAELANVTPARKAFVIPRLAPAGQVTLFTGPGSAGKSLFMQQVCTAMAAGVPTLGLDMGQGATVYLSCEDDAGELHYRQTAICKALGLAMAGLAGRFTADSLFGRLDNVLGHISDTGTFVPGRGYERIAELVKRTGAKLVGLDNVAHLFAGNENDRAEVTQFVSALNRLAGETGAAIVLLTHTNKAFSRGDTNGNAHSGSTAWVNAVRSQFLIEHDQDTDLRTIKLTKANYAQKGEVLRFYWFDWAFALESDIPADTARAMAETMLANADNKIFLNCLCERNKQRRQVSEKPTAANFAPKQFEGMAEAKGLTRKRLEQAMDRLYRIGAIERGFLHRDTAEGKNIEGLREVSDDFQEFPETSPETSRKQHPEGSGNPRESTGNTLAIPKGIIGGAHGAAPPYEDLDWNDEYAAYED